MERQIALNEREVSYTLKVSSRARGLRLSVYPGGAFVVTAPRFISSSSIEQFILRKAEWVVGKIDYLSKFPKPVRAASSKVEYKKYKAEALRLAEIKIAKYNAIYGFKFNKISIKNQKTRWGSCSKKGNLNFSYRIALLTERQADYIIVHELCHLGEFNHSRRFWELVAKTTPDYRELRRELKNANHG